MRHKAHKVYPTKKPSQYERRQAFIDKTEVLLAQPMPDDQDEMLVRFLLESALPEYKATQRRKRIARGH